MQGYIGRVLLSFAPFFAAMVFCAGFVGLLGINFVTFSNYYFIPIFGLQMLVAFGAVVVGLGSGAYFRAMFSVVLLGLSSLLVLAGLSYYQYLSGTTIDADTFSVVQNYRDAILGPLDVSSVNMEKPAEALAAIQEMQLHRDLLSGVSYAFGMAIVRIIF